MSKDRKVNVLWMSHVQQQQVLQYVAESCSVLHHLCVLHRLAPSTNHAHHLFLCIASVTSNTHLKECFIRHALHVYLLGLHVYLLAVEASLTSRVNVVLDVTCAPLCIVSRAQRVERMGLECRSARLKRVVCCRVPRVERGVTSFMPAFMPA